MNETHVVNNQELSNILIDTKELTYLDPFFKGDVILSDVAEKYDIKLNTLLYKVNKWIELGLVEVVREETRNGRAIKIYQATAKTFIIPFSTTDKVGLTELLVDMNARAQQIFYEGMAESLNIFPNIHIYVQLNSQNYLERTLGSDDLNEFKLDDLMQPEVPACFSAQGGSLFLNHETAKEFQKELIELLLKYNKLNNSGAQRYDYHIGLAPITSS